MKKTAFLIPAVVVLLFIALSSLFIVDERQRALVLQFGRVVDVKAEPGIAFKIPLIQEVVRYDDRILSRDIQPLEVTPLDDRRLVVDAFARYRINDVRGFRQAVGTGGIPAAEARLDSILRSQLREVLGSVPSNDILSADRDELMGRILEGAKPAAAALGIDLIDVRLKRTDLPQQNLEATFARMRAEREREAADQIARGNEAAQRIRAQADRQQVEIVSDANRQSEIIRGQADARSNAVYAQSFGADEEFFEFYRSLDAYREALGGQTSTMVLSPNSDFFNYLTSSNPGELTFTAVAPEMPDPAAAQGDTPAPEAQDAPAETDAETPEAGDAAPETSPEGTPLPAN